MKVAYAVAALGASFLGGFFLMAKITPKCTPQVVKVESDQTQEKIVTEKVINQTTGKVETVVKTEYRTINREVTASTTKVPLSQFRIGVAAQSGLDLKNSTEVSAGYRIKGPIWIDTGYNIQKKEIRAGVSVEF